jgi:hypothetical protein
MRLNQLSTELLEQVIDQLAANSDKPALRACALASPVLRPRARHHLFSIIRLASFAPHRASALADLVDADPALGACVASLSVSAMGAERPKQAWLCGPGPTGLCAQLARFPRLATLELNIFDFRLMDASALAAALPASLKRLAISNSKVPLRRGCRFTPHSRPTLAQCKLSSVRKPIGPGP